MVRFGWILCALLMGVHAAVNRGFKSLPTTVKTYENDTVLLPCDVENLGVQTRVRWWRDGIVLADTSEPQLQSPKRVRMWSNRSLEVSHVTPEDTGKYVCQTSQPVPWGYATQVHEIEVMYPSSVQPVPESGRLEVNLGEEVSMGCASKGVPAPLISWRTKDEEIPLIDHRPQLRFHADNRSLAGRYTCVAYNGIGDPATADIDLLIRYKPEIEVRQTWVHASPGIRAQLKCTVTAWPEAKVEWAFKNETVLYSSRIVKHSDGSDHSLVIRNVRPSDYGRYLCRASNSLGITEAVVELSGLANPAVFKKESHAISKTSYNFIWEVDSYSPIIEYEFRFRKYTKNPRTEWYKLYIPSSSDDVSPVHVRSFNLTGLEEANHYEAFVLSKNRYGWSKPSRIFRFATEGAPANIDSDYHVNAVEEEKVIPVVQLASMSQHSPMDVNNGGSFKQERVFLVIFSVLCILNPEILLEKIINV